MFFESSPVHVLQHATSNGFLAVHRKHLIVLILKRRPVRALGRWVVELEAYSAIDACAYDLGTMTRSP